MSGWPAFILFPLVFIVTYVNLVSSRSSEQDLGKLIFANVLFRHGDRTPVDPYPNDPYKNTSFWPVAFGQLTNKGKEQEYELGQWLRARYDSLLTDKYTRDLVYVQSTDVDRTLMSAASSLAGMYPPKGDQRWHPDLDWQPIPIHTTPTALDKVLAAEAPCPAYEKELEKVRQSPAIQELNKRFSEVYRVLNEYTGMNVTKLSDIDHVFSTLFIENLFNLTLPEWTKSVFPNPMEEASKYSFALPTWSLKLARLKSGLLVQDMIKHMKHKKENKKSPNHNMWIYSAHDTTVANLLNTLGVFDVQRPPYSSAVLMELRVDSSGNHQVMLFYRNYSDHEPYLLTLPGCTPACPLDQFISLCEPVIPKDWDGECQTSSLFSTSSGLPDHLTLATIGVSSLMAFLVALYYHRRKRPTHCGGFSQLYVIPVDSNKNNSKPDGPKPLAVAGLRSNQL